MSKSIRHLTNVISITLGMRLFSMSIIIPFLSVYAMNMEGGKPSLTGFALGIFGLTQAILQIPFGALSDRIGYKKVMIAGLIMLIAGLLTAAYSTNVYWLIFARALQGSGAIVTVGYSWISSIAGDEQRDKELTKLGAVIGSFTMLSYTIGPLIHIVLNVSQMFVFSACLIFCCLVWIIVGTKQVDSNLRKQYSLQKKKVKTVFNRKNLTMGFMLTINSLMMMSFFFMISILLEGTLETNQMWVILTPAILISMGFLPLFSKIASRGNCRLLIIFLFLLNGIGFLFLFSQKLTGFVAGTIALMTGSFAISTIIPMLANRGIDERQRGKGNGVIVSLQYFGSFLGAALTGGLWSISENLAFLFAEIMACAGITLILTLPRDKTVSQRTESGTM